MSRNSCIHNELKHVDLFQNCSAYVRPLCMPDETFISDALAKTVRKAKFNTLLKSIYDLKISKVLTRDRHCSSIFLGIKNSLIFRNKLYGFQ